MSAVDYREVGRVLRPKIGRFSFYIDDGGSSSEDLVGYTTILLDQYSQTQLESEIRGILEKYAIDELHARTVNSRNLNKYDAPYDELIASLAKCFATADLRYCSSRLGPNREQNTNYQDLKKFIMDFFNKIGMTTSSIKLVADPLTYLTLPLAELATKTTISQSPDVQVEVWVDRTSNYDQISNTPIGLPGSFAAPIMPFYQAALHLLNPILLKVVKTSLQLSSIQFTTPERCPILQLVDAIANFSLNFIRLQVDPMASRSAAKTFKKDKFEKILLAFGQNSFDMAAIGAEMAANWSLVGDKIVSKTMEPVSLFVLK